LLPAAYGVAVILGITVNAVFDHVPAMLRLNQMHALALAGGGALLIGMLIEGFLRPPTVAARQRIKVAALGAVLAFVLPVAGMALFALSGVSFPLNFLALPLSLFPLAIGWAILKNDLFEVDAIIRRTVAWAVLSVLLAAVYLGGLAVLDLIASPRRGRIGQLLFLLIIVAVFPRLRDRVQHAVDFLFARDRYDYRRTVSAASQALATLLDVDAIVDRILLTITGAMHVGFSSVWLRDGGGYRLHAVAGTPRAGTVDVAVGSALTELLEAHPRQIVSDDASPSVVDELHHYGGTLVVPMSFENRLSGFLVLGEKESGASYSGEDLGLLQTLADQGAVAVQNARSYAALVCANDELRAAQSRLLEAERLAAIGELSAAVAHGIRNPLAGIKAAAQLAQMDLEDDHPMQESIRDILAEAGKLEARIKTLLDFARPFEPQPAPTALRPLIESAIASLQSQLSEHAIEVSIQIDPPALEAHLDAAQIEEVLLALISNAIEAMTQGGRITITAHPDQGGQAARLEISDTGPGIPAEQLSRVFGLFFTTKSSGTGFGLAVAKKVVERHGGTITVDNRPGEGACFTIVLPLRAPLSRGEGTRRPSDSPT
jgi:signal transduction histidine kinase